MKLCICCEEVQAEGMSTFALVSNRETETQPRCFNCRRKCNSYWTFVSWQGFDANADALHVDPLGWVP